MHLLSSTCKGNMYNVHLHQKHSFFSGALNLASHLWLKISGTLTIGSAALAQLPWNGVSDLLGALGPRALAISPWSFVSACFLNVMDLFKKTTLREIQVQKRELYLVKDTI